MSAFGVQGRRLGLGVALVALTLLVGTSGYTRERSPAEARRLASAWLQRVLPAFGKQASGVCLATSSAGTVFDREGNRCLAFVLKLRPVGFVLVAAEERVGDVLGFSTESDFVANDVPRYALLALVRRDVELRLRAVGARGARGIRPLRRLALAEPGQIYGPYLTTRWGQGNVGGEPVFNLYSPNHWPVGCVATALAQVLDYYRWPRHGQGTHLVNEDDVGVLRVNFDSTWYDWGAMLDDYSLPGVTLRNKEAVGLLSFHCAVALDTDFERSGSTASVRRIPVAASRYFRTGASYLAGNAENLFTTLRKEMVAGRPAVVALSTNSGAGHAAVVDGYFEHNGFYHLNLGWYGQNNGWYDLAGSFNVSGYSVVDGVAVEILPVPEVSDSTRFVAPDTICVRWFHSARLEAATYELQLATSRMGPWETVAVDSDTVAFVDVSPWLYGQRPVGTVWLRVRAQVGDEWSGWSARQPFKLRPDRKLIFAVTLGDRQLGPDESVVVRGSIPPLAGTINSAPFEGPDSLGVYRLTVAFDYAHVGELLKYRFAIAGPGTFEMEVHNREVVIGPEEVQPLPVAVFNQFGAVVRGGRHAGLPKTLELKVYPNPSSGRLVLEYSIPQACRVWLRIYNVLGQEVFRPLSGQRRSAGRYRLRLDLAGLLAEETAAPLPTGVYLIRLGTGTRVVTAKVLYVR